VYNGGSDMSIEQKKSLATLRFYLYDRAIHPELFDIRHSEQIARKGYDAQIWVTGCMHVIGFFRDRGAVLEVLADRYGVLPRRGRLLEMPLRGEKHHECRRVPGIRYMMGFQVESMTPAVYSRTHHDLARLASRRGLFVPLPGRRRGSLTPFAYIDYSPRANELHVFAFHAFPEDHTLVKTQSIFELA